MPLMQLGEHATIQVCKYKTIQVCKLWTRHRQVKKKWTSYGQVVNKSWASNNSWTSQVLSTKAKNPSLIVTVNYRSRGKGLEDIVEKLVVSFSLCALSLDK